MNFQENEDVNKSRDFISSYPPPSISANSSTPIRPENYQIPKNIPGISPIKKIPLPERIDGNTVTALDCSGSKKSHGVISDKQYTKLGSIRPFRVLLEMFVVECGHQ